MEQQYPKKIYIGVDNGLDGAIVAIDADGTVLVRKIMPTIGLAAAKRDYDLPAIVAIFQDFVDLCPPGNVSVVIERAGAMPGQGVSSTFKIGRGFGMIEGVVASLGLRYQIVHPLRWQKAIMADVNRKDTKQASAIVAGRLFPGTDWRASERSRKAHDGLTDAACMAEYARRVMV